MQSQISSLQIDVNNVKEGQYKLEAELKVVQNEMSHLKEFRKETRAYFAKVIWLVILTGLVPLVKDAISI